MVFIHAAPDFWDLIDWCRAGNPSHHAGGYYDVVYGPVTEDWKNRTIYEGYDQVSFHNQNNIGILGSPQWRVV